jgi:hypothetical protein
MANCAERVVDAPADVAWAVLADPDRYAAVAAPLQRLGLVRSDEPRDRPRTLHPNGLVWLPGVPDLSSLVDVAPHRPYPGEFVARVDHRPLRRYGWLFRAVRCTWTVADHPEGTRLRVRVSLLPRLGPVGRLVSRLVPPGVAAAPGEVLDAWADAADSAIRVPVDPHARA